jgi:hypothetical protein
MTNWDTKAIFDRFAITLQIWLLLILPPSINSHRNSQRLPHPEKFLMLL